MEMESFEDDLAIAIAKRLRTTHFEVGDRLALAGTDKDVWHGRIEQISGATLLIRTDAGGLAQADSRVAPLRKLAPHSGEIK